MPPVLQLRDVEKSFRLHLRSGTRLPVIRGAAFEVAAGECAVLHGPSGSGKSSLLKMIYGTYPCDAGEIRIETGGAAVDVATADTPGLRRLRRDTVGYVSQFLRVIPRVAALDIVAEPVISRGGTPETARVRAADLLARLNLPERLWSLPPATFSGGEQQRVNIARGFARPYPLLLLDEPTASLDAENRRAVVGLIEEARAGGAAILGIFHDEDVRERLADRIIDVGGFAAAA
ncbi:MAG: phosphonate C-P lyase system protein PhnL [Kiloniellales bacterium]|nr:phosphonate C-P lyase system protein PhnL [Kiloniellales bacterium]